MTVLDGEDPAAPEPLIDEERAAMEAYEGMVCKLAALLMRLDGNQGDPHALLWTGGPIPEPWGDAWQKYEPQALSVIDAIGEASAHALVAALSTLQSLHKAAEVEPVAVVVDTLALRGVAWVGSASPAMGMKLYASPQPAQPVVAWMTEDGRDVVTDAFRSICTNPAVWTVPLGRIQHPAQPKLEVWFGSMPETNGKRNWTAILHAGDIPHGLTLDRSEYHDRVRYEADRARHLIGELPDPPDILAYDPDLREPEAPKEQP